jgi:hypothetical protein
MILDSHRPLHQKTRPLLLNDSPPLYSLSHAHHATHTSNHPISSSTHWNHILICLTTFPAPNSHLKTHIARTTLACLGIVIDFEPSRGDLPQHFLAYLEILSSRSQVGEPYDAATGD